MANSADPDQTPRSAASESGLQFAQTSLSEYLGYIRYVLEPKPAPDRVHFDNLINICYKAIDTRKVQH